MQTADTKAFIGFLFLCLVFQKNSKRLLKTLKVLQNPPKSLCRETAETLLAKDLSAVTLNAAGWSLTILLPSRVTLFSLGCISCWRVCRSLMVELSRTRWMWRRPTQPTRSRARLMSGRWLSPPTEIFRKAREGRVRKVPFCKQEVHGRCKSLEDSSVTFKDLIHLDRLHLHVRKVKVLESVQ